MNIEILTKKQAKEFIKEEMDKREEKMMKITNKLFQRILRLEETMKIIEDSYRTQKWKRR